MITERLPFELSKTESFYDRLGEWIGDVFYDILPEKGFELRDEQIYMAFQLERSFKEKKVIFAEAGVGTGKTIVYLLYALCYARYTGKPAIIACADETLIEQLVKEEGDIAKISRALDLNIDVRLAKSQDQYLCLQKLDRPSRGRNSEKIEDVYLSLPDFVHDRGALQSFYHYGDRKDYPELNDEEWQGISWDSFQDCLSCDKRHRCGLTLSRDHYRKAADLIVCSHDFYMEHVWTYDARKREGQLPLLPEASSIVFDEGHLLEYAAQKALTYRLKESTMETLLTRLLQNDVREEFAVLIEKAIEQNASFFHTLKRNSLTVSGSDRMDIAFSEELLSEAKFLHSLLGTIGEELVFESQTYTIDHYELNIVDEHIDRMEHSIGLLLKERDVIAWVEASSDDNTLVIMPRAVEEVLREKVFSRKMPIVFSSATLSENKSFDYIASSLGVSDYLSSTVESPFDYDEQMEIFMPAFPEGDDEFSNKFNYAAGELKKTNGRALLLFNTREDLRRFKQESSRLEGFSFLFEGDAEISQLVSKFQNEEETVLCAVHLWEGLDIPGPSLSNVIIWSLPFPPNDPVFQAKRKSHQDHLWKIDVPYMILRLRQGIGRLIRSKDDTGSVSILVSEKLDPKIKDAILKVLPVEPK